MGGELKFDCQSGQDNEFVFVRFFATPASDKVIPYLETKLMFVFDRSALAVLVPLALLLGVAAFSSRSEAPAPSAQESSEGTPRDHTVAANLPSR
jgi:hypothetical protein